MYYSMPINMFFIVKNHWEPYFTDNLRITITILELCGLVVRVLGYRSGGPGSIPGTTRFSEGKKKENSSGS
jgi:hypothetical protein